VLLDLQGAWLAPPEYDLVCLLRDSYVELPEREIEEQLAAVRPELPDAPAPEVFAERFDLLTLARKGKDHALFHFVARTRGDARYLRYVPTTVRQLRRASQRAAQRNARLTPLAELIAELPETPCEP
jgi:aminoglycoside/choline kinase family phosphotransferase